MYKHIIPQNISDNGDFFGGAIKKRNLYEAVVVFLFGLFVLKFILFAVPFLIKTVIFVFFPCAVTVLALVGIGDQSMFEALGTLIRYRTMRDILPYSLYTDTDEILLSKKEEKEKERAERKALRKAKKLKRPENKRKDDSNETGDQKRSIKDRKKEKKKRAKNKKKESKEANKKHQNKRSKREESSFWDDEGIF